MSITSTMLRSYRIQEKGRIFLGNHIATRNLLEAAKDNPQLKRFIFVGSQTAVDRV